MRRFVTLALILVCTIPMGLSISGCKKAEFDFCNGGSSGEQEGQITNIDLEPRLQGLSLAYGSSTQVSLPGATDCKGDFIGIGRFSYGTTNITYADISPGGALCAGSWNRNTPGGVPDYTTCTPPLPSQQLAVPPNPAFTTPTAPTATAGATSTLNYPALPTGINGTVDISIGGGAVLSGTISNTTNSSNFATAFNAISAFSTNNLVATASTTTNIVTITGPAGLTKTLSFAGTNLAGYVPAAYITASAGGATSNAVPVYVHPVVSSMQLASQSACFSQGTATPLAASVTGMVNGVPTDITSLTGPLIFLPSDSTVVSINSTVVPPIATAQLPGSTIIAAATSNATSPAGLYFTCPPKSITLSVPNSTSTTVNLSLNAPQALSATVLDTNNKVITGLKLNYVSTSLNTLSASPSGSVGSYFPGAGAITAICQPGSCNPAPLNSVGVNGDGLPVTSNPITFKTAGTVNTVLYIASTNSQYFTDVDFSTGAVSSPILLPFVPNSMIADKLGQTIYFGSPSGLIEVNMPTNTVRKTDTSVKGTVVGVSDDGSVLVMSDAVHNLIYVYSTGNGSNNSFGGTATRAAFSPDNQNIYITGSNPVDGSNFWVYSSFDGWHTYTLAPAATDIAVTVPSIGAYLANPSTTAVNSFTTARSYCPSTAPATVTPTDTYYTQADSKQVATTRVAATFDSKHILGAYVPPATVPVNSAATFSDLQLTMPSSAGANNPGACPPAGFTFTTVPTTFSAGVQASSITGVLPDAGSQIAFVTYTSTSTTPPALLPAYVLAPSGPGTLTEVTLSGSATAPVSGVFSPDNHTFYTGTAGDNLVHIISVPNLLTVPQTAADTGTVTPALPLCLAQDGSGNCTSTAGTGFVATPNMLADRPRATT
jgi:trimeric autotransporter adhesin